MKNDGRPGHSKTHHMCQEGEKVRHLVTFDKIVRKIFSEDLVEMRRISVKVVLGMLTDKQKQR